MWSQATSNHITYPLLCSYGWKQPDPNCLLLDWNSESNASQIKTRVALIRKGCGCRTTNRCKYRKEDRCCGPGYKCLECKNLQSGAIEQSASIDLGETESDQSDVDDSGDSDLDSNI